MKAQIAAEVLKVRTTRAVFVAIAVVLAYAALAPVLVAVAPVGASVPDIEPESLAELVRGPVRIAGGAMLLVGLLAASSEFSHGTVLTTRLAEPRPTQVLAAKSLALALVGLVVGVLLVAVALGAGALLLWSKDVSVEPLRHGIPGLCGIVVALMVLHALLGVAIGSLLRNTAAAVGLVLTWVFVVEGVLPLVTRSPGLLHWLPGGAVIEVLARETTPGQLAPVAAAALLAGYGLVIGAASAVADRIREL